MTMHILKRNGKEVDYDGSKVVMAIQKAMLDIGEIDNNIVEDIESDIMSKIVSSDEFWSVEEISDEVEKQLMEHRLFDVAKTYILYRNRKKGERKLKKDFIYLSDSFLAKYKHRESPFPNQLGELVYYRTYSRWMEDKKRREYWWETVARAVDYNCSLVPTTRQEAEKLYDNVFNLRQFLSGRTFWIGGTDVAKHYPMANFNCSFTTIDSFNAYKDLFYLLMIGSGVGLRILKSDVVKLPKIRTDITLIHEDYTALDKNKRVDSTSLIFPSNEVARIVISDSKEAWVQSLDFFFKLLYSNEYRKVTTIILNYDNVRPKGEKLKTFGGTASGYSSLKNMFTKINKVIVKRGIIDDGTKANLKPIDCLDIANIIGENVVVGGVRRCLPKGSLVHTKDGLIPIEDVKVGMLAKTSNGYSEVSDWVDQGQQELLTLKLQNGDFKCTPKHKMAKMTSVGKYDWIMAKDLKKGDRLVFVKGGIDGTKTEMPSYKRDKKPSDTNSIDLIIPELDIDISWFLGYFHGNGYVAKKEMSLAVPFGLEDVAKKLSGIIERFGVNPRIETYDNEKCYRIRVKSVQFAEYLSNFKTANTEIIVPDFIMNGSMDVRKFYLLGLYEADGTSNARPVIAVSTIYPKFLYQIQSLYASIGISSRTILRRKSVGNWKDLYELRVVGESEKITFESLVGNNSTKYKNTCKTNRSQNDYGYPSEWFTSIKGIKNWSKNSKQMTISRYENEFNEAQILIPVEVLGLDYSDDSMYDTYDITVKDVSEFVCGSGLLVHNTAEIVLLDSEDKEGIEAKTSLYKQIDGQWIVDQDIIHRQMSNNSIYYQERPTRERLHWQIEQMRYSGEPAWINEVAGAKRRPNMNGCNPSMPKDVLVQTMAGVFNINELEGKEFYVKSLNGETAKAQCWLSGECEDVYTLDFGGNRLTHATLKHKFPIVEDNKIVRKSVSEIKKGDKIPLNRNELQGFSRTLNYEDGLFAGIMIGDGSITKRSDDDRYVASFTVNSEDFEIKNFVDDYYTHKTGKILKWNKRDKDSNSLETNFGMQEFVKGYLIDTLGLTLSKDGKSLPVQVWTYGDNYALGMINGLFSTDGSVDINGENKTSIRVGLTTSQKILADEVQKLLGFYGVSSTITSRETHPTFPNGKIYDRKYYSHQVRINGNQVLRFNNIFKMIVDRKQSRISNKIKDLIDINYITVKSVEYRSSEAVWDVSVEHNQHVFPSQHCYTGNCGEILLDSNGLCNLTTVNVYAYVKEDNTLDYDGLIEAQRLSAKAGYRMTCVELEIPEWNYIQDRDKLLGCSLTGWQDMVNATGYTKEDEAKLLRDLKEMAIETANKYADSIGQNRPLLITTVKPEGCWSKEAIRTLDNGIFFIDEIDSNIFTNEGFTDVEDNFTVLGNKVTKTYVNDVKDILEITLKSNRRLRVSKAHPLSVLGEWTEARDLKLNDILDVNLSAYNKITNSQLNCNVDLSMSRSDVRDYTLPHTMSNDLSWLVGSYYANGCFTSSNRIKFHCEHYNVHLKVQRIWLELFGVETNIIKSADRNSYTQDFASVKITKWIALNELFKYDDDNNKKTRIPLCIRTSSKEAILSYIVGYADNDGCFSADTFCIDSAIEDQVRHMQEVGEAVGLVFGFSVNRSRKSSFGKNDMYKIHLSRAFSDINSINFINENSIKGKVKTGVKRSGNPFKIVGIRVLEKQETFDIEVENIHMYHQGGLISHNTLSQLPTVSSGVHYSHSPYYIRRVRINADDPLAHVCQELGFPMHPEVGQEWDTCSTKVVEFPVKAPKGRTKYNVSAIEQLENYTLFMENYVQHNCSITVHVRNDEWEGVEQWVWEHWDDVVALSFLSLDDNFYDLLPYEAIEKEEYDKRANTMKRFYPDLLSKYEKSEVEIDLGEEKCESGACPIR